MIQTTTTLPTSAPEAQGIDSAAISAFVDAVEREADVLHSFILLRHGQQVAAGWWAPYGPEIPHMLFSLSKSFTSTAIGLLVAEGRLSVDDFVLSFFPEDAPDAPSENLKAMRVRHLLSMATGHAEDTLGALVRQQAGAIWTRSFLSEDVVYEPGTHFLYNSGATYMLSAIVQKITGERMLNYLQPRLFAPLGIQNPVWETSPQGIDTGGWGLSITTADIARFGQLYLQKGVWQGQQLIPESWVAEATTSHIANGSDPDSDWAQGYGYQFWMCRHNAYRGDGAFGQYCLVLPEQDAVLAITSGLADMQAALNLVWQYLLPALGSQALPENPTAQNALSERLANLRLRPQAGNATSPIAAEVSGKVYTLDENPAGITSARFSFADQAAVITFTNEQGAQEIACGFDDWRQSSVTLAAQTLGRLALTTRAVAAEKVAASGAWITDNTFVAKVWWYETPFARTLTCVFAGDQLTIRSDTNVSFGSTAEATLVGYAS